MSIEDLSPETRQKYARLEDYLSGTRSLVVAFSGGVDSGLLAAAAHRVLGTGMLAVTVQSPVESEDGVEAARRSAEALGFAHRVVSFDDLADHQFVENTPDRCYICKRNRLGELIRLARDWGFAAVAEGSNADDRAEYRPGKKAVAELGVLSPLVEAGLTKNEVRQLAKEIGLPIWDRPSAPCLATRFPYGTRVTLEGIRQIDQAESYLRDKGFNAVRVRHYGALARIEVEPGEIARLVESREEIAAYFRQMGYTHTAVDLLGYRSGSLNEGLGLK